MTILPRQIRTLAFAAVLAISLIVANAHASLADRRDFTVHNNTDYSIQELYVSPHSANNWEEDILGSGVVQAHRAAKVHFSDSLDDCYYDIKAVYEDGDTSVKYNVDLCSISDFTFYE